MKTWGGQIDALSLERQRLRHKKSYDRQQGGWMDEAIVCSGSTFQFYVGLWCNDKRATLADRHKQKVFGLIWSSF